MEKIDKTIKKGLDDLAQQKVALGIRRHEMSKRLGISLVQYCHLEKTNKLKNYFLICPHCKEFYLNEDQLNVHIEKSEMNADHQGQKIPDPDPPKVDPPEIEPPAEYPYPCPHCEAKYKTLRHFTAHMEKLHPEVE